LSTAEIPNSWGELNTLTAFLGIIFPEQKEISCTIILHIYRE
jgi:hypothetical protein